MPTHKRKTVPDALGFEVNDSPEPTQTAQAAPADVAADFNAHTETPATTPPRSSLMEGFKGAIRKSKALAPAPSADDLPSTLAEVIAERVHLNNTGKRLTPEQVARLKALDARFAEMNNGAPVHDTKPLEAQEGQEENLRKYHFRLRERLHEIAARHPHLAPEINSYLNK